MRRTDRTPLGELSAAAERAMTESMEAIQRKSRSWDAYFMSIARQVATRATCDRKHVGAVFVRDRSILATGYNGSIRGLEHCDDVGHMMRDGHCVRTIHAEANAIVQAAGRGVSLASSTVYVTASPCWECFKLLANLPVARICYGEFYREERIMEVAPRLGIELVDITLVESPTGA